MENTKKTFEEIEKAMGKRKTLDVCRYMGCIINVYTRRDGSNVRVLRVEWPVINPKNPKGDEDLALYVWKSQLFEFSPKGLDSAYRFIETCKPSAWDR